jgi:hypothetical protein
MAERSFIVFRTWRGSVDMGLEYMARAEDQDPPREDRHFFAGLRIATDTAPFLSDRKGPEPTDFNSFSSFEPRGYAVQDIFQQVGRLIARQSDLSVDHFGYMSAGDRQHNETLGRSYRHVKVIELKKSLRIRGLRPNLRVWPETTVPPASRCSVLHRYY